MISVWSVPSLRLVRSFSLEDQSCFDDVNPELLQLPSYMAKKKSFFQNEEKWHACAVKWWDSDKITIIR